MIHIVYPYQTDTMNRLYTLSFKFVNDVNTTTIFEELSLRRIKVQTIYDSRKNQQTQHI